MKATDEQIIEMARSGASIHEIMSAFGYQSDSHIYTVCKRNNVQLSSISAKHEKILELRKQGDSPAEIAERFNLTEAYVTHYCAEHGICERTGVVSRARRQKSICPVCGSSFEMTRPLKRYCSNECGRIAMHRRHDPKRRARKKGAEVVDQVDLRVVCERDGGICWICGEKVDWNDCTDSKWGKVCHRNYPSIDHVYPLIKGGRHSYDNVRLAHIGCNASKGVRTIE